MIPATAPKLEFNQSRLGTFQACARKFYLRHIASLPVPPRAEMLAPAHAEQVARGQLFHKYVERALKLPHLPLSALAAQAPAPIDGWLGQAGDFIATLPPRRYVEYTLSLPFQTAVLTARYDLVAVSPERILIVDWKTSERPTPASILRRRMQHVVFPFVLTEAAPHIGWGQIVPEQVEIVYWFSATPQQPLRLRYSQDEHRTNARLLQDLVTGILARQGETEFPKVADTPANRERLCAWCTYMHHCERSTTLRIQVDLVRIFDEIFENESEPDLQAWEDESHELAF